MDGMDVGAAIEEQRDNFSGPSDDRPVQRRASRAVAAVDECRVGIEELADALGIAGFSRQMNRMIGVRRGRFDAAALSTCFLEDSRDRVVSAIPGYFDQAVAMVDHAVRFSACFEQDPYRFEMSFPHGELDEVAVDAVALGQRWTTVNQTAQGGYIAGLGRCDGSFDIRLVAGVGLVGIDHAR